MLAAASRLFAAGGIEATSMDAIAAAAAVGKATLYKHWPDKDRLALEVLSHLSGLDSEAPAPTGDLRQDLVTALSHEPAPERAEMRVRMMPHVVAYAVNHPVFGAAWRERSLERQRRLLTDLLRGGIAAGALDPKLNVELALALLAGPPIYRHIAQNQKWGVKPERAFVVQVVDAFLRGFGR